MTTVESSASTTATHARQREVALVGNPNTGKTTLFNRLTGARQRVGNYAGVTVEKKVGSTSLPSTSETGTKESVAVIDLPGTYSLAASSDDERVVIDVLMGRMEATARPDVVVCVVDATNLMRNIFLASQVADIGLPVVIALNMSDAARELGLHINVELLSERLGVPVVATVASRGDGIDQLKAAIATALNQPTQAVAPMPWPEPVNAAVEQLKEAFERDTGNTVGRVELLRMLFDADSALPKRLKWSESAYQKAVTDARRTLEQGGLNPLSAEPVLRYARLGELLDGVVMQPTVQRRATSGESADRLLTHRVWGLATFVAMMWVVFQSVYWFADFFMAGIENIFGWVGDFAANLLTSTPILQSLVVDGIIAGIGGVIVFLPQILILFFFISLLEDTGYMARAAFLMDKLFSWCGLNGKSFVPLLSSYACAIPGVMATRTIEDPKARLTTILIAPLMSCSARLPVYVLLIAAFIEPTYGAFWAGFTLFGMHFVGLIVALPVAWLVNKYLLKTKPIPFVMEMPPYRAPQIRNVIWRMTQRGGAFIKRAGTVIIAMTIIIWALCYFPQSESIRIDFAREIASARNVELDEAVAIIETDYADELAARYLEASYMGTMGKAVQPIFALAGFDWKITVGILSSFPARETIIATLGILYNLGTDVDEESEPLRERMASSVWTEGPRAGEIVFTPLVAVGIMVFFALCMQCGATLAVIGREAGWRWAVFCFIYMTTLAWAGAVAVYQVGQLVIR